MQTKHIDPIFTRCISRELYKHRFGKGQPRSLLIRLNGRTACRRNHSEITKIDQERGWYFTRLVIVAIVTYGISFRASVSWRTVLTLLSPFSLWRISKTFA